MALQGIFELADFRQLDLSWQAFAKSTKTPSDKQVMYNAYIKFLDIVINGVKKRLNNKSYKDTDVIQNVIKEKTKNDAEKQEYLRMILFCIQVYCEGQKGCVIVDHIDRYEHLIYTLLSEIEYAIKEYDEKVSGKSLDRAFYSRNNLHLFELYILCKNIQYIETVPMIEDLYFRDIRTTSIFLVRQFLERLGKEIIGYSTIYDKNRQPIKKFSQVAWDFLKQSKCSTWHINPSIPIALVNGINRWANNFIHTTIFSPVFVQSYIINYISFLIRIPERDRIIGNSDDLRNDFKQYLSNLHKADLMIQWDNGDVSVVKYKKPWVKQLVGTIKSIFKHK